MFYSYSRKACAQVHTKMDRNSVLFGNAFALLWLVMISLCIISAIIFFCADGVSKQKNSAADPEPYYGAGCAAACGAGCGA
ncbi:hypothetical protein Lal_00045918 [Lupinus albus]|nr:hypothetical protein Lal_00045918 [Lupinus albus]